MLGVGGVVLLLLHLLLATIVVKVVGSVFKRVMGLDVLFDFFLENVIFIPQQAILHLRMSLYVNQLVFELLDPLLGLAGEPSVVLEHVLVLLLQPLVLGLQMAEELLLLLQLRLQAFGELLELSDGALKLK